MSRRIRDFDAGNRTAAHLVLGDVVKYGGLGSLMVRWARLWIERHGAASARDTRQPARGQMAFAWKQAA